MALTQISTQGIKDGTITGSDLATNVDLVDNQKLRLGTSNDLQIFHDGSNSHVTSGTGQFFLSSSNSNIWLRGTETGLLNTDGSEYMIRATSNGSVKLFYDNSQKLETTSNGAIVTGSLGVDELYMGDNEQIKIGAEDDFLIYHGGSENVLDGVLHKIELRHGSEKHLVAHPDGAVELYYDNSKKFETLSDGVSIPNDNDKLKIGASQDLYLWHNGSTGNSNISNVTGDLFIQGNNGSGTAVNQIAIKSNAAVELNYQGTKKFETLSGGAKVTGHFLVTGSIAMDDNVKLKLGTSDDLQIYHDGSDSYVSQTGTGNLILQGNASNNIAIRAKSGEEGINVKPNGAVELYHDNSKKFETYNGGVEVFGDLSLGDNRVLNIGTGSDLQIYHNGNQNFIKSTNLRINLLAA